MNILTQQFKNKQIRIIVIDNIEWFVAKDMAMLLEYKDTPKAIKQHCKKYRAFSTFKGVGELPTLDPQTKLIPEPDVWRLIIKSRLPEAEKIEEWIFEEVLPSIRKTGSYSVKPKDNKFNYSEFETALKVVNSVKDLKPFDMLLMDHFLGKDSPFKRLGIDLSGVLLLPTELGKLNGKSAIEINRLLFQQGYQVKVNGVWQLTEKGKDFGLELNGKFQQIKWKIGSII